jgi:hypothetical protein
VVHRRPLLGGACCPWQVGPRGGTQAALVTWWWVPFFSGATLHTARPSYSAATVGVRPPPAAGARAECAHHTGRRHRFVVITARFGGRVLSGLHATATQPSPVDDNNGGARCVVSGTRARYQLAPATVAEAMGTLPCCVFVPCAGGGAPQSQIICSGCGTLLFYPQARPTARAHAADATKGAGTGVRAEGPHCGVCPTRPPASAAGRLERALRAGEFMRNTCAVRRFAHESP